jgi:hypothetical protein
MNSRTRLSVAVPIVVLAMLVSAFERGIVRGISKVNINLPVCDEDEDQLPPGGASPVPFDAPQLRAPVAALWDL